MSRYTERAAYFKMNKRCVRCGKQDAYTLIGKSRCFECAEKNKEYARLHHKKHRETDNSKMRDRVSKLKEQGVCIDCGVREAVKGRTRCRNCLIKNSKAVKNKKGRIARTTTYYYEGLCWLCCKNPTASGYGLCEDCLERARKRITKAQRMANDTKLRDERFIEMYTSKYNNESMEKCEYIEAMQKVYFDRPKQENGKCNGFVSKYGKASLVCQNCKHFKGIEK